MVRLSLRSARLVFLASLGSLGYAAPGQAQVPVFPAPDSQPAPPAPVEAAPAAESAALPAPPAAPPHAPASPPPESAVTTPVPARAGMLTQPQPQTEDDDTREEDEGNELGPRRIWYGWQTLLADGASFGLMLGGAAVASRQHASGDTGSNITGVGVLGYTFAPAIVHFIHRNPGRGFASIGLRIGLPIAAGIVGAALSSGCDRYLCESDGAAVGALLGVGGAIAMDAALFAYDAPKRPTLGAFSPRVIVGRDRAWLGIGGEL